MYSDFYMDIWQTHSTPLQAEFIIFCASGELRVGLQLILFTSSIRAVLSEPHLFAKSEVELGCYHIEMIMSVLK